jgi:hypothetical protein
MKIGCEEWSRSATAPTAFPRIALRTELFPVFTPPTKAINGTPMSVRSPNTMGGGLGRLLPIQMTVQRIIVKRNMGQLRSQWRQVAHRRRCVKTDASPARGPRTFHNCLVVSGHPPNFTLLYDTCLSHEAPSGLPDDISDHGYLSGCAIVIDRIASDGVRGPARAAGCTAHICELQSQSLMDGNDGDFQTANLVVIRCRKPSSIRDAAIYTRLGSVDPEVRGIVSLVFSASSSSFGHEAPALLPHHSLI